MLGRRCVTGCPAAAFLGSRRMLDLQFRAPDIEASGPTRHIYERNSGIISKRRRVLAITLIVPPELG
jgi:hypothetical protein